MLILAIHGTALRALAAGAVTQLGQTGPVLDAAPDDPRLPAALRDAAPSDAPLLVHDFAPDVDASMRWLDTLVDLAPELRVLALLGAPADSAVHQLVSRAHRFACVDVALGHELTRRQLAERLDEARQGARQAVVSRALTAGWPLDALLQSLAQHAYAMADGAPWPSLTTLLQASGVARRTFVRHAARAGFRPPLRFLQVVRVAGVAAAIRRGETTAAAAARFGYGSTDTLRRHFAAVTGLTPRDARHLEPAALIVRMRDGARHAGPRSPVPLTEPAR
ncbi:MAG: helix-turn-helix domain-containing protein [Gemmatirosa sp.]